MLESMTEDRDHTSFIKGLYQNILGREADEPGLRFWEVYEPRSNLVAAFTVEAHKEIQARAA